MKAYSLLSLMAAALAVAGCSTTHSSKSTAAAPATAAPAAASSFDTAALVSSFVNSDVDTNKLVNNVVQHVNAKNYKSAASELQKLVKVPGLTASQESAVKQLAGQLATKVGM